MKWEYQVIAKTDLGDFTECLNRFGEEGWEAISGTYTLGEIRTTRSGMGNIERPGALQWVAILKRQKSN